MSRKADAGPLSDGVEMQVLLPRGVANRDQEGGLSTQSIIVTVSDDMLGAIHQVADDLAARGMEVHRVMPVTGVITGAYGSPQVSALEHVSGVASVEHERITRLSRFDSPAP